MSAQTLRVIDFGRVSPLRSQTLWHAIAYGVSAGAPPTLSFMRPNGPYVSIGFHRRLDEVDGAACRQAGLPVYRRMVGGGPVYLDDGQLFFQITVPASSVPATASRAMRHLLEPAVAAFRAAGIDATLEDSGDIVVGDRKICGHGGGQIDGAVIVVGNLITRFDHHAASCIIRVPDRELAAEVRRLMQRYVAPTEVETEAFTAAMVHAYGTTLRLAPVDGELTPYEIDKLAALDEEFTDPEWLGDPVRPKGDVWWVKIKAGVWVTAVRRESSSFAGSLVGGRIVRARLFDGDLDGARGTAERSLEGRTLAEAKDLLSSLGDAGKRLAALVADVERTVRV